ncbi:MAG TPA: hypothetical protein VFO49_16295, partial [Nocardioides sp.]|nr:hypothetical protein [Nocardioides sp.]
VQGERPADAAEVVRSAPGRLRAVLIVVPLIAGLLVVAGIGARMLLADIPDPEPPPTVADVTCWDGTTRPAEDCTTPSGRAGLRWIFPSFKPDLLGCRNVLLEHPEFRRPTMFECEGSVPSGRVTITYSELNGVAGGRAYLEKEYGVAPDEIDDERLQWTDSGVTDGIYESDVMYADAPFAVEVRARSAQARDDALDALIRFRPADHITVRP